MRIAFESRVLLNGLLSRRGPAAELLARLAGRFTWVSSEQHLKELRAALGSEALRNYVEPAYAGVIVDGLKAQGAQLVEADTLEALATKGQVQFVVVSPESRTRANKVGPAAVVTAEELLAWLRSNKK